MVSPPRVFFLGPIFPHPIFPHHIFQKTVSRTEHELTAHGSIYHAFAIVNYTSCYTSSPIAVELELSIADANPLTLYYQQKKIHYGFAHVADCDAHGDYICQLPIQQNAPL